jgi:hypothetical protein
MKKALLIAVVALMFVSPSAEAQYRRSYGPPPEIVFGLIASAIAGIIASQQPRYYPPPPPVPYGGYPPPLTSRDYNPQHGYVAPSYVPRYAPQVQNGPKVATPRGKAPLGGPYEMTEEEQRSLRME